MNIQWLGTAGFRLESCGRGILTDPYLSRNSSARPVQTLGARDLAPVSHIFISHGHFDHLMDVAAIARATGACVAASPGVAQTLAATGLSPDQIQVIEADGQMVDAGPFRARAFYSAHVTFDLRLMAKTLVRAGLGIFRIIPLLRHYPCGRVLSWRIEAEGRAIHFFGSAGSGSAELAQLNKQGQIDLLLVPLQGHSRICDIALRYVEMLHPGLVIPQHFDDFYPPLSQTVDICPFISRVEQECPGTRVRVLGVNETLMMKKSLCKPKSI